MTDSCQVQIALSLVARGRGDGEGGCSGSGFLRRWSLDSLQHNCLSKLETSGSCLLNQNLWVAYLIRAREVDTLWSFRTTGLEQLFISHCLRMVAVQIHELYPRHTAADSGWGLRLCIKTIIPIKNNNSNEINSTSQVILMISQVGNVKLSLCQVIFQFIWKRSFVLENFLTQ